MEWRARRAAKDIARRMAYVLCLSLRRMSTLLSGTTRSKDKGDEAEGKGSGPSANGEVTYRLTWAYVAG